MKTKLNRSSNKRSRAISGRPRDPIFTAQRFPVPNAHIPQHVIAPSVSRIVRFVVTLTSGTPSYNITYATIAAQDGIDYSGSGTPRYATMRMSQARCWAESPASLSVSQVVYGLVLTDIQSGFSIRDKPTTGSRLAAIGFRFPFNIRQLIQTTSSTVAVFGIACDTTIASSTDFTVTMDISCEFYG